MYTNSLLATLNARRVVKSSFSNPESMWESMSVSLRDFEAQSSPRDRVSSLIHFFLPRFFTLEFFFFSFSVKMHASSKLILQKDILARVMMVMVMIILDPL